MENKNNSNFINSFQGIDDVREKNEYVIQTDRTYCGLTNQGTTCYLNSLLQSLFMTPEFRKNILQWEFNEKKHGKKDDCIMFQLQKLFARMQLKFFQEEETKDLTKSFQWDSKEIYQQHDIQVHIILFKELCRVLFDAIEQSLGKAPNFINNLYEGSLRNYLKCLKCGNESIKEEKFMDLSLPVRSESEKIYNTSLEMALCNLIKPEKLEKENQYFCELCKAKVYNNHDIKVDAIKYLSFENLPKILIVQLNRFEYDFKSDTRRKLFDKVTFPQILNMNIFLKNYLDIISIYSREELDSLKNREVKKLLKEISKQFLNEGQHVYELYSIVLHSGNALGGHYFVYIKSFEDNFWYCYNDSLVSKISCLDTNNIFGSNNGNDSSAVGYLLMYRKINGNEQPFLIENSLINEELKKLILIENDKRINTFWKPKEKSTIFTFNINGDIKFLTVNRSETIYDLKKAVLREYKIDGWEDDKNFRLRVISNNQFFQESFPNEDLTLEQAGIYNNRIYSLEIKKENNQFEEYLEKALNIIVYHWDANENDPECRTIKINKDKLMSDLKDLIFYSFQIKCNNPFYCFKRVDLNANQYNLVEIFDKTNLNKPIHNYIFEGMKLYVEFIDLNQQQSKFKLKFDEKNFYIQVKFNTPLSFEILKAGGITIRSYKFDFQIDIHKKASIKDLRAKIAENLNIEENTFIMKKFSHMGQELKNNSETLDKLTNSILSVYIEYGNPMLDSIYSYNLDQIKINTFLCEFDFSRFNIFPYRMIELSTIIFENTKTIQELKNYILKEILFRFQENIDFDKYLIRENVYDKPGKILFENQIVKNLGFTDGIKICIQEYKIEKPKNFSEYIQITIREWDPFNWTLSVPTEIFLPKKCNFLLFSEILSKYFPHISVENIEVYKIINTLNVFMDDFKNFKFENLSYSPQVEIDKEPLYLQNDGNLLIIMDKTRISRDPTIDEIKSLCRPSAKFKHSNPTNNPSHIKSNYMINNIQNSDNYNFKKTTESSMDMNSVLRKQQQNSFKNGLRHKEKGLKIKVKKNIEKLKKKSSSNMEIDDTVESEKKIDKEDDINFD